MYLLIPVFLSVLVALARGKDLSRFEPGGRFRAPWLVILILVYRIILYIPAVGDKAVQSGLAPYLNPVPYILLLLFIGLNLRLRPIVPALALIGLGTLLNLVVMLANGGFVPVRLESMLHATDPAVIAKLQQGIPDCHNILMDESSRLTFLADNFWIPRPLPFAAVFSIGDAIIGLGAFWLFQSIFPAKR